VASTLAIINSMTNVSWLWFPDASLFFLYAGYALFGAIVKDYQPSKRGAIACAVLAGIGAIATFTLTALISQTAPNELFDQYGSPTVIFTSCFAFLAFRGLLPKIPEARVNLVRSLSRMAFGVYFVHIIIIIGAFYIVSKLHLEPRVLQVAVIAIVTLIPSVAIVWALQLNRFGRWLAPV
jgi:surface polysaccharide O-acyltransferase-like enzyme